MTNAFTRMAKFAEVLSPASYQAELGNQAASNMKYYLLAGLGGGAAWRGVQGLANLVQRRTKPPKAKYPQAITTEIPIPVAAEPKLASIAWDKVFGSGMVPGNITDRASLPLYPAAAIAATGLGAYGGWKGVDAVLDHQRQKATADREEKAKADFEQALLGSYSKTYPVAHQKLADDQADPIERLFEMSKQGNWSDALGKLEGGYGLYALATGAPAAYWAYNRANATSDRSLLDKAMKRRVNNTYLSRPSEIYAVPKPVPVGSTAAVESEPSSEADQTATDAEPTETIRRRQITAI